MTITDRIKTVKSGFTAFLKSPKDYRIHNHLDGEKFKDVLVLVIFELCTVIPIALIIFLLEEFNLISVPNHIGEEMIESMSFLEVVFYVVILAPIIEEFLFRTFIVLRRFYPLLLYVAILETMGRSKYRLLKKAKLGWNWFFPALVIISSLLFGYVHISNFKGEVGFWLVLLLVSPQAISGFFHAYVRVRYGLVWSMILHAAFNLILVILEYIVPL